MKGCSGCGSKTQGYHADYCPIEWQQIKDDIDNRCICTYTERIGKAKNCDKCKRKY